MLQDIKQAEMDLVEKFVLDKLEQSNEFKLGVKFGLVNPQKYINKFEEVVRPLLDGQGLLDSKMAKDLIAMKYPQWSKWIDLIPTQNVRMIDIVNKL